MNPTSPSDTSDTRDPDVAERSDAEPAAGEEKPPTGGDRLRRALRRPSRGQAIVAVLLALLGFAAAVQIRFTQTQNDLAGQRRSDLVELLDSLSGAADQAEQQIRDLRQTRRELQSSSRNRAAALQEARERLEVLGILSGTTAATGPGVVITINDPKNTVTAAAILNGIEELRDAGAEAIAINNKARVVASTSFTEENGTILVDGEPVKPPYVIDAIGSSHTLSEAVVFPGGLSDQVSELGGTVSVKESDKVVIKALHRLEQAQYAQPTDR